MRWFAGLLLALVALLAPLTAAAFELPSCSGMGACIGYDSSGQGFVCTNPLGNTVSRLGKASNVSVNVGSLSLGTKTVTVTGLTGLQAGDICTVSWGASQALTVGLVLAGCRASGAGQADIQFSTPLGLGVSVGTITLNIAWMG